MKFQSENRHNSKPEKAHKTFAKTYERTKNIRESLLAAGYSENTARKGTRALTNPLLRALSPRFREYVKKGRHFNPEELEAGITGFLIRALENQDDNGVQAAKALGNLKRVQAFTPEWGAGVIIVHPPRMSAEVVDQAAQPAPSKLHALGEEDDQQREDDSASVLCSDVPQLLSYGSGTSTGTQSGD